MKSINEFLNNKNDEQINEDLLTTVLLSQMVLVSTQFFLIASTTDVGAFDFLDYIKNWWKDHKANKIIQKLAKDNDIQQFLKDNEGKQGKGWRDLVKSKLSEEEYQYISRITQNKTRSKIK